MKKFLNAFPILVASLLMCLPLLVVAAPEVGKPAPDFVGTDSNGKTVKLTDLKGKIVVLEWTNNGCPFVKKWYKGGAMQKLQQEASKMGIVWLTVVSSAPGQQGYVSAEEANQITKSEKATPAHVLLDPKGTMGRLYDARTTPQVFIISADGKLAYMGGADSIASTDPADIQKAQPYVHDAMEALAAGKPVKNPVTKPYGCSVKY